MAQYNAPLYASYTTKAAREKMNERIIKNTITKNLSLPITEDTEGYWEDAFNAMQVFDVKTPFTQQKVLQAFDSVEWRSPSFQRALLEVTYAMFPGTFDTLVLDLIDKTFYNKIFAMGVECLLNTSSADVYKESLYTLMLEKFGAEFYKDPTLLMLSKKLISNYEDEPLFIEKVLPELLNRNFLRGKVIMYSFQRKNRDYPGLVLLRKTNGDIVKDSTGQIFHIPQLARSITNLPFYLRNGNTPQGIFRMYGFEISRSNFIGPTANVQMGMPVELNKKKYFGDTTISDSIWALENYQQIIPGSIRNYFPLYEAYYAGLAGRNEIIAHGTTVDPELYAGKPYYPLTPTMGCLCTKEIWNGIREESDQQKLVNGLLSAGGANGYAVVIEIDDKEAPVTLEDLRKYLK